MLLKTKLTNMLRKEAETNELDIDIYLKNISVNGIKRGCDGHVVNKANGSCVYLTTEESCYGPLQGKAMYRLAENTKDWSSNSLKNGYNRWVDIGDIAVSVICLLATEKGEKR